MEQRVDTINNILASSVLGSLLGIAGIIIAIVTYVLTRKVSRISGFHEYTILINKNNSKLPQQVSVMYDGSPVERVSSSEFIIWNSGNSVINNKDLITMEPLRIEFSQDIKLLRYQIVASNNPINNIELITLKEYPNSILIDFDFLEKDEGMRIEVLHTGTKNDIYEKGKLIGVKSTFSKIHKPSPVKSNKKKSIFYKIFNFLFEAIPFLIIFALLIITAITFISPESTQSTQMETKTSRSIWPNVIFLSVLSILFIVQTIRNRPPYPSNLKKPDN